MKFRFDRLPYREEKKYESLKDLILKIVKRRVRAFRGNKKKAALSLGISVSNLERKLDKYDRE